MLLFSTTRSEFKPDTYCIWGACSKRSNLLTNVDKRQRQPRIKLDLIKLIYKNMIFKSNHFKSRIYQNVVKTAENE